jgi:hypothetical protein
MKRGKSIFFRVLTTGALLLIIYSCEKHKDIPCEPSAKGRIIGYHPCRHNSWATSHVQGLGFVVEIDNGISKDTAVTYGIPNDLLEFPAINDYAAMNGSFLYHRSVQDQLLVRFNYRFASDNEKTGVLCLANIWTAPFDAVVKGKEIFISCVSKQ